VKALRNSKGITMVEIMVSIVILVLLVLVIGVMLTASMRSTTYNEDRHIGDKLAEGLMEKVIEFAGTGANGFGALVPNNFNGAMPNQPAIPAVRQAIPNEPANDRIYNDFNGDGVADWGVGGKRTYVYQMIIDDIPVSGQTGFLKQVTIRIYFADQSNPAQPTVDLRRHRDPGGVSPRRFLSPLSEITTYVSLP
jgi:hypothetical protein